MDLATRVKNIWFTVKLVTFIEIKADDKRMESRFSELLRVRPAAESQLTPSSSTMEPQLQD